jgi:RNA polymerase sigma factor (sigma-70 family)
MQTTRRPADTMGTAVETPVDHIRLAIDLPPGSPEQLFVLNLPRITRIVGWVARRHRMSPADAEEFASEVYLALIENDYRVLREFRNKSTLHTFLAVVINRLYLDFRVKERGRWRPSANARRAGPSAVLLERLMSRDGIPREEAVAIVRKHSEVEVSTLEPVVASKPRPRLWAAASIDGSSFEVPDPAPLPDELLARLEIANQLRAARRAIAKAVMTLAPVDRQLIILRFREGLTIPAIASRLDLNPRGLYRRIDRLVEIVRRHVLSMAALQMDEDVS